MTKAPETAKKPEDSGKPKASGRSPSFPYVDLRVAIEKAKVINEVGRGNPCSKEIAFKKMGVSPNSGPARRTLAALKSFGLVSVDGETLEPTPLAHKIIEDERSVSPDRDRAIRKAALSPPIHGKLWAKYRTKLPDDEELKHHLYWNEGFNKNSIPTFISEYKMTLDYAKLDSSATVSSDDEKEDEHKVEVGSWVQWESQGALQLPEPKQVQGFSPDGSFAFVEGATTGLPVVELILEKAPKETPVLQQKQTPKPPSNPFLTLPKGDVKEDVFTLESGDVVLRWPKKLSQADYEDLKSWLSLMEKKLGRSVVKSESEPNHPAITVAAEK